MSIDIAKRLAKIGSQIASQRQKHGDDNITAIRIPVSQIALDERELCALLQNPLAHRALFDTSGDLAKPSLPLLGPLPLREKLQGATVSITHGVQAEVLKLSACTLSKIKLEPQTGGMTELSCTVNVTPALDLGVAHLLERLDSTVEIEISGGAFAPEQQELELEERADDCEDAEPELEDAA